MADTDSLDAQTLKLQSAIRLAISDPGSYLPRNDGESVSHWSMRAVMTVVECVLRAERDELRSQLAESQREVERLRDNEPMLTQVGWFGPYGVIPGGMDNEPHEKWRPVYIVGTVL